MSWWLAIPLGYLIVCWTLWLVFLRMGLAEEGDSRAGSCAALRREHRILHGVNLVLSTLVMGPLLPLFAAHCTWVAVREWRTWSKFARTHREAILEPMHPVNIPQPGQKHFDRCAPALLQLKFILAGTYLYKPEPLATYIQCLLSAAGETVADIALIDDACSVSFVSVLANGHVLETSCSADPLPDEVIAEINESGRFTTQMLTGEFNTDELARTYRRHLELLAQLEQRFDCGTLHLPLDQVPALKRYENAVFGEVLFSQGKVDNQPPPPQPPIGITRRISVSSGAASGVVLPCAGGAFASLPVHMA